MKRKNATQIKRQIAKGKNVGRIFVNRQLTFIRVYPRASADKADKMDLVFFVPSGRACCGEPDN